MFEFTIAIRHINSRRRHTFFSLMAVALAVSTISPQSEDGDELHLYKYLMSVISEKEGVVAVSPYLSGQAALKYKDNAEGVLLKGIEPEAEDHVMHVSEDIVSGSFTMLALTGHGIVLGDKLADNLEVGLGDNVEAIYPGSNKRVFKVVGIINTGTPIDESIAYARLGTLQELFRKNGVVTSIGVRVKQLQIQLKPTPVLMRQAGWKPTGRSWNCLIHSVYSSGYFMHSSTSLPDSVLPTPWLPLSWIRKKR